MRWQFTLKVINLPRQARDKHRGNIKECRFLAGGCGFCKVQPQRRRHAGPRRDSCAAGGTNAFYTKKMRHSILKKTIYQDRLGTNIEKTQKEMRFFSQEDAKFVVDASYVDGVADMFGTWDTDGSGGVELAEFRELWAQRELCGMLQEAGVAAAAEEVDVPPPPPFHDELAPPPPPFNGPFDRSNAAQTSAENAATSSEQGADVAEQIFVRWNQNGDAILDMAEVEDMLEACAFEIDAQYIDGLADLFGTFDQDDSGVINAYNLGQFLNMISLPRQAWDKHRESTHTKEGDHFRRHPAARISADV